MARDYKTLDDLWDYLNENSYSQAQIWAGVYLYLEQFHPSINCHQPA